MPATTKVRKHFVAQKVDLVPDCGAYKQRIEKELRSLKPRENVEPPIGPYAIPDRIPAHLLPHLAGSSSTDAPSSSSYGNNKPSSRSGGGVDVAARLQTLEQQIQEEREGRKLVEAQLERLQTLLQRFSPPSGSSSAAPLTATAAASGPSAKPVKGK